MNQKRKQRIIVVLGMHRSGTSTITRALGVLGVELGEDLFPARSDNPKGFWEDRSVLEINEHLLRLQDSAADKLAIAWDRFEDNHEFSALKVKATQLISQKLNECNQIWGFKEPRTCRLLSFWFEVFEIVGCEVGFVIALRNPASVVASLSKRDNIPAEKSYLLWLQHTLPTILQTRGFKRVVIDYDKLLAAPYEQLVRISSSLDLPLPVRGSSSLIEFESDFLETQLRHTHFSLDDLLIDNRAPKSVINLYTLLLSVACDKTKLDTDLVLNELKNLNESQISFAPISKYVNSVEGARDSLWYALSDRDEQIANLNTALVDCNHQLSITFTSLSWRLTKPLRYLRRMIERFK